MQGMGSCVTTMDDPSRMPGGMPELYEQALEHGA